MPGTVSAMGYAEDVTAAKAAVDTAQKQLDAAKAGLATTEEAVVEAQQALDAAKVAEATAQDIHDQAVVNLAAKEAALKSLLDNPPVDPPPTTKKSLLGMSSPTSTWNTRLSEVQATGGKLQARRNFQTDIANPSMTIPKSAVAGGMAPIISFKVPSWSGVGSGQYDDDLVALGKDLAALNYEVWIALHHEPAKSGHPPVGEAGTPAQWAQMQRRGLPIIKAQGAKIRTCVIGNGWWWNSNGQRYSDAEIAQWIPADVRKMLDAVAADTYQMGVGDEEPSPKMLNMVAWAKRMGDVKGLGIGEFNSTTAKGIADACATLKAEPLFRFGCVWNTNGADPDVTVLTGARLTAFQTALKNW